jgi:TRAP-type mannitol/chloroaromatic compound transport system permease small subunit
VKLVLQRNQEFAFPSILLKLLQLQQQDEVISRARLSMVSSTGMTSQWPHFAATLVAAFALTLELSQHSIWLL